MQQYQEYINDLDELITQASKNREQAKEIIDIIRPLIKFIYNELNTIKYEATEEEITKLKQSVIRMRQVYHGELIVVIGYIIAVLYHFHSYRDVISIVESYFPKTIDYSYLTNDEDIGVFGYYYGLTKIKMGDYRQAATALEKAFVVCKEDRREELLMYLVPLKLRLGQYPSKFVMNKYGCEMLKDLCDFVSRGDIGRFEELIHENEIGLFRIGMYEVYQSLRLIVYRNLIEKISIIKKTHKLFIQSIVEVANSLIENEEKKVDSETVINILMNMHYYGILKANLIISMNALVMQPQNALEFYSDN